MLLPREELQHGARLQVRDADFLAVDRLLTHPLSREVEDRLGLPGVSLWVGSLQHFLGIGNGWHVLECRLHLGKRALGPEIRDGQRTDQRECKHHEDRSSGRPARRSQDTAPRASRLNDLAVCRHLPQRFPCAFERLIDRLRPRFDRGQLLQQVGKTFWLVIVHRCSLSRSTRCFSVAKSRN